EEEPGGGKGGREPREEEAERALETVRHGRAMEHPGSRSRQPAEVDSACGAAVRALTVGRLLISADSHVMEPLDLWTSGLPAHLRAQGPRVEPREGGACLLVEDTVVRRLPTLPKAAGPADAPDEKTFMRGASDPTGRLRDLDAD